MIESRVEIIKLTNVKTGTHYRHKIQDEHPKLVVLTWYELMDVIELYEPTANLNKILIQVKRNQDEIWEYITNTFAYDLRDSSREMQIRYKLFQHPQISAERKLLIEEELIKCQSNLKEYQTKFDINSIDINVFWASPVFSRDYREGSNKTYPVNWKVCCQGYINQIGKVLNKCKKRVYFSTNLLDKDCFTAKNYSIVYLLCHTECYQNRTGRHRKEYLIGEKVNGQLVEILPKKLHEMLKDVSIELLIFHTSYPYYHLQQIKKCQNIKNILLIRSSPVYHSQSTSYFLNQFFTQLLSGITVKQAHRKSLSKLETKFSKDQLCCCYHEHNIQCQFHATNCSFTKLTSDHYRSHKIFKKENVCCCPIIGEQKYDYKVVHKGDERFIFSKNQQDFQLKSFDFQDGQLQGDAIYLKAFETRQSLLGNRHILPKLLQIFSKPLNYKKGISSSKILNIYNKMCGDKLIFIENLANFLIRRKVFIENRSYELKNSQNLSFDKNPQILYTLFCDELTLNQVKKLKQLDVNIILVSQKQLNIEKVDPSFGSIEIKPLEKKDCMNYIKAQKHLSQVLKDRVAIFFDKTWAQKFKFVYYPSNFDYKGLMTVIARSQYGQDSKKYINGVKFLMNKGLLEDYILFMSLSNNQTIKNYGKSIKQFSFYSCMTNFISPSEFVPQSLKYFHLVDQQFFQDIPKFLISILMCFVKLTFPSLRRGYALFEATTDCYESVTYTFFKRTIQKCHVYRIDQKLEDYFNTLQMSHILQSTLRFVKNLLSCFYLYDVLDFKQELYKNRKKNRPKETPKPQDMMMQEVKKQDEQAINRQKEKLKQKDADRLWQLNMQDDKKSYALILCLLIVNNAIIYRKYEKSVVEIDQQGELDQYFQENLNKYYQRSSISVSNNGNADSNIVDEQNGEGEEQENESNKQNESERDIKVYEEMDFTDNLNYLSRKGLFRILSKILNKKPPTKVETVCHSYTLQLILQFYYMHDTENENASIKIFEKSLSSLSYIILSWQQSDSCKYRIAYDVLMFLIQVKTWCGRDKINNEIMSEMKKQRCLLRENRKIQWFEDQKSNQTLKVMSQLSDTEQVYEQLKKTIQICQSFIKKKPKQEPYLEGLEQCLQLWHQLNSCVGNIKQEKELAKSYLALFNMKNMTEEHLLDKKYMGGLSLYVEYLLVDLDSQLELILKELSQRLLVLFVPNNYGEQKFIIDIDSMIERKKMSQDEGTRNMARLSSFRDIKRQQLIIKVKIILSKQNVDTLRKRGGCRFLIISAVNSVEIRKTLKDQQKSSKIEVEGVYQSIAKLFLQLCPQYFFVCLLKDNELMQALRKYKKQQQQIVRYDCKKLHIKPDDAVKSALMITISLAIASKIKQLNNFIKALQSIFNNLKIIYHYKSSSQQEHQFPQQNFNCEQIRSITVLEPSVAIKNQMEQRIQQKIEIDYSGIIKEQYLLAVKCILNIIPLQPSKKSILHVQKTIDTCIYQIFIANLKFYLMEQGSYYHFFEFNDEDSAHSPLTSSQSKDHPMTSKFFEELLGENSKKFLSIHNSTERMIVVIKNFTFDRKQAWMNEQIKSMFFETERTKLETRYVKIGQVPCLISIRN